MSLIVAIVRVVLAIFCWPLLAWDMAANGEDS